MIPPKSNIYLETSAINFLADKYSYQDGRETYTYHKMKGTRFYISNVSIWEILLTSNKEKREQLIQYIQNIGHPKLINSPSEMIINYIMKKLYLDFIQNQKMLLQERVRERKYLKKGKMTLKN